MERLSRLAEKSDFDFLHPESTNIISREEARQTRSNKPSTADKWRLAASLAVRWSRAHYNDTIGIAEREHMSPVDCFDGKSMRCGARAFENIDDDSDLLAIHPIIDGRLHDEGRE